MSGMRRVHFRSNVDNLHFISRSRKPNADFGRIATA
jgi:hypothetical protein